ncbi:MAG: sporulation transcriptional regulator SpoIIID [Clostridia bacterium]|nr:sporulation transcriptional regulator SpoIIID [Clostridia bacterium]
MIEIRTIEEALCLYENNLTVREVAKMFGLTKTPVHIDLTKRLPQIIEQIKHGKITIPNDLMQRLPEKREQLIEKVESVLKKNKAERHFRGGNATKLKFDSLKKKNK